MKPFALTARHSAADPEATNDKLNLLRFGVGNADFLYKQEMEFNDYLKGERTEHQLLVTDGGHPWMNSRHHLTETLQLYFK
jgi:enterochelin esterase-like enzyme